MPELIKFIPTFIDASGVKVSLSLVEPKASGKSIAQIIRTESRINIAEIKSTFVNASKIENARACSSYIESGRVILVKGTWNETFLRFNVLRN
jgi:phage terminase large subunit-like protein